ncbi:ABC transporter ATP-binding protein [Thermopirellula anaerolimosa]
MSTRLIESSQASNRRGAASREHISLLRLLRDSIPLLFCHRGWLTAVLVVAVLYAVLDPMQGVVIKKVADGLSGKDANAADTVMTWIPWYIVILMGLAFLQFLEKSLKGFYDPLITFELQRTYLRRRPRDDTMAVVSRIQYDCRDARKAVEVYVRDVPAIIVGIVTVFVVQWTLSPDWLPALLIIVVFNLGLTLWLGRPIRRSNREMFLAVTEVARSASPDRLDELHEKQERLYGRIRRREGWMGFSEVMMQFTIWVGCLLVIWLAHAVPAALGVSEVSAGSLALFVANVQFLSKPLINIGKAYNKFCSTEPALRRAFYE